MNDRVFIDTNILVYLYSEEEEKRKRALRTFSENDPFISYQVINEFVNVVKKKFNRENEEILEALREITSSCNIVDFSMDVIESAIYLNGKYKYSYYDCLVISAGLKAECSILFSEDMQHNQLIENKIKITNPFV